MAPKVADTYGLLAQDENPEEEKVEPTWSELSATLSKNQTRG